MLHFEQRLAAECRLCCSVKNALILVIVPPCNASWYQQLCMPCSAVSALTCANADNKGVPGYMKELRGQDTTADQHLSLPHSKLGGRKLEQLTLWMQTFVSRKA
jgi:hypothetical protein